jgi:hypothetical protein
MLTSHITICNDYSVAQFESLEDAIRYVKTIKINKPEIECKAYELREVFNTNDLPKY